jgi:Flp pilus assembly protein TadG
MMRQLLLRFRAHDGGGPAIEFALVLPIVITIMVMGIDGWQRLSATQNMAAALHAGARYYQEGGVEDDKAIDVSLASWAQAPDDAEITITRDGSGSQTNITLEAQSTFTGIKGAEVLKAKEVVRVQ